MIEMSRRWVLLILALVGLSPAACNPFGHACGAVGCIGGVIVSLQGGFDPDKPYTIELSRLTPSGEATVLTTCTRLASSTAGLQLSCTPAAGPQTNPYMIQILDNSITGLRVVISADGGVVGQKDYAVHVTSDEINGPGCGVCTGARVSVDFPMRPVWGAQGMSIASGTCGDDDVGAMQFTATRDQLSAEQLQLLSAMQEVPDPRPTCPTGQMQCFMQIFYDEGAPENWYARPSDGTCYNIPNETERVISYSTFDPFRQTLGCWYSRQLTDAVNAAAGGDGVLPVLEPSAICQHGLVVAAGATMTVGVDVPAAGGRQMRLHFCNQVADAGRPDLQLRDSTGANILARGAVPGDTGTTGDCQAIEYDFSSPGTYLLRLIVPPTYPSSSTLFLSYQ